MSSFITSKAQKNCSLCNNLGIFPNDKVYYPFCETIADRFCDCSYGSQAFAKWIKSQKIQEVLLQKRKEEATKWMNRSGLSAKWFTKSWEDLEGQEQIKRKLCGYLDQFGELRKEGRGIYLFSSGSGRGKTTLLGIILRKLIEKYLEPCLFLTEEQMYSGIRETFQKESSNDQKPLEDLQNTSCLFIDDLGATKITSWKNEVLTAILDYRLNHNLPTFFSSNYSLSEYKQLVASSLVSSRPERIPSRICEMCRGFILGVPGKDWRQAMANVS